MTQQQYTALVNEAQKRSYEYYVLAAPTISDREFDALVARIEQTEQQHPEWTLADSPTQAVGSDIDPKTMGSGLRIVRHRTPMLSCQKAQTLEAVEKFLQKTGKAVSKAKGASAEPEYALEWKWDGVSCSLVYQDGVLVSAASRGKKIYGQDWTRHARHIGGVPQTLDGQASGATLAITQGRVEVRGEIVCPKAALARLSTRYKDCRTAAASLLNQQTAPKSDLQRLRFVAFQLDADETACSVDGGSAAVVTATEHAAMQTAATLGFETHCDLAPTAADIEPMLLRYETERNGLKYPTDGIVIKLNDRPTAHALGYTEHHPKASVAYKFTTVKTTTRVLWIEMSVGEKTGRVTPIAHLEPVTLLGRTVSSASLGSERTMQALGVTEGATVIVGLSNDVKPQVYGVIVEQTEATEPQAPVAVSSSIDADSIGTPVPAAPCSVGCDTIAASEAGALDEQSETLATEGTQEAQPPPAPPLYTQAEVNALIAACLAEIIAQAGCNADLHAEREAPERETLAKQQSHEAEDARSRRHRAIWHTAVTAAVVCFALVIICETGLLIPLGLVGLATSGFLK